MPNFTRVGIDFVESELTAPSKDEKPRWLMAPRHDKWPGVSASLWPQASMLLTLDSKESTYIIPPGCRAQADSEV